MTDAAAAGPAHWSDPTAEQVAPGVFRIPLPLPQDGLRAVNVYALRDDEGRVTLVDGGWAVAEARTALDAGLHRIGSALTDVTDVLVTHAHRDHYTLAVVVRRELGTRVSLGVGERVSLDAITARRSDPDVEPGLVALMRRAGAGDLARLMARNAPRDELGDWEAPDRWLEDGESVETAGRALRVVHTPGHTRGHVVLHDEDAGLLFSGDHVLTSITPSIGFEPVPPPTALADFMASLRLLTTLPDARVLPGHGAVGDSVHARVAALLDHHEERLAAAGTAVAAGASTAHEVARVLPWTRHARHFDDLDTFNRMLATGESLAHLAVLVLRGRVDALPDPDGVLRHTPRNAVTDPDGGAGE